ncbi:Sugar and other transporter [Aspergillus sp. HF37]|nr:Sugar and other transporter [Aspergillus sp. HF37]
MEKQSSSECAAAAAHHVENIEQPQPTLQQSIRLYPKIVAYSIGLTSSFLLAGYDAVIVGTITAVPRFQADFGERYGSRYIIPSVWMSLWSALGYVGSMVGGAVGGPWQDRAGRKWPLAGGSLISAVAIAVLYVSNLPDDIDSRRGLFLAGKIILGFSSGILMAATQTYISETAPTSLRGPAMALFPTFMLLGQIIGAGVIFATSDIQTPKAYLTSFASQWPFSAVPLAMAILVPESPSHLVRCEQFDAALRSLTRLHTSAIDPASLAADLDSSIRLERELAHEVTYRACFAAATNRRRTLIVCFASAIPALFGLPLLSNASYYMQIVGMKPSFSIIFLILGIGLGLIANGAGIWRPAAPAADRSPWSRCWSRRCSGLEWALRGAGGGL